MTEKGGALNAMNYVVGMFNHSITLYAAESINLVLGEIVAWTTDSPYTGNTQSEM